MLFLFDFRSFTFIGCVNAQGKCYDKCETEEGYKNWFAGNYGSPRFDWIQFGFDFENRKLLSENYGSHQFSFFPRFFDRFRFSLVFDFENPKFLSENYLAFSLVSIRFRL